MILLLEIFGYVAVILEGLAHTAQAIALGGLIFIVALERPLRPVIGPPSADLAARTWRLTAWFAFVLALAETGIVLLNVSVLADISGAGWRATMMAPFAIAGLIRAVAALMFGIICLVRPDSRQALAALAALGLIILGAALANSHAASRMEDRSLLMAASAIHQLGAATWPGGLPAFLFALNMIPEGPGRAQVARRYSTMSITGVALIFAAGVVLTIAFIDLPEGAYGTAHGVMVATKVLMFFGLIALGLMNSRVVARLAKDPSAPIDRLKRFVEVEIGVGIAVLFVAATITSVPPAIDLPRDRATFADITERLTPRWPRFETPSPEELSINEQAGAYQEASSEGRDPSFDVYIPGLDNAPPKQIPDIVWSEYNHHWAGLIVLIIGLLALGERSGLVPFGRHWPLMFLALAAFLLVRADAESWPLGHLGFFESMRQAETLQHRFFTLLIVVFALFEWSVRTGRLRVSRARYVFPLICAAGGGALLTHTHSIENYAEELLVEITHVPIALLGITAGWARWLELRADPPMARVVSWIWPACFVLIGIILLIYRES